MKVGLISDTHGLLRPEALDALAGCAHILHAGDIGSPAILEQLATLAPVSAIRGNNDTEAWARALPDELTLELAGHRLLMLHDLKDLRVDPAAGGYHAVISGHSHKPAAHQQNGVLYVNPGSAGRRRFRLPIALGWMTLEAGAIHGRLLELDQSQWVPTARF